MSKTQKQYDELGRELDQSAREIRSIADKTEHLANYKESILANVEGLSAISAQNAASNQDVNGNVDEIMAQIRNVSEHCGRMGDMADELKEAVAYFRDKD